MLKYSRHVIAAVMSWQVREYVDTQHAYYWSCNWRESHLGALGVDSILIFKELSVCVKKKFIESLCIRTMFTVWLPCTRQRTTEFPKN